MSYANTEVAQIAAISSNRCIGKGNELPWHISADLQHFKSMTTKQSDGAPFPLLPSPFTALRLSDTRRAS